MCACVHACVPAQMHVGDSPPLSIIQLTPKPPVSWRHTSTRLEVELQSTILTAENNREDHSTGMISCTVMRKKYSHRAGYMLLSRDASSVLDTTAMTWPNQSINV